MIKTGKPNKDTIFVPIYKYADKLGVAKQSIYRWIREQKIPKDKYKVVEKVVTRIVIDESYRP